ncbi:MAG: biliverdin-producing heme oxygenase [Bacteroidota bacterium]
MSGKQASVPTFLEHLRMATRPAHTRLERLTEGNKLLSGDFEVHHYGRLLRSHLAYHRELSRHVAHTVTEPLLDWPDCARIPALAHDLESLGLTGKVSPGLTLPLQSEAYTLGLCYVAEGSCMGNMQLHRALSRHEHFQALEADHFYLSCGTGFRARWQSLMQRLAHPGAHAYPELEKGALDGFDYFGRLWRSFALVG